MKFQEIDFHIELLRASLEPKGTKIDYLEMLRKESKFKRDVFLIKMETAFDNIHKAYQNEVFQQKSKHLNWKGEFDLRIPFYFFNKYPILTNFSNSFNGQFDKNLLAQMNELVNDMGIYYKIKGITKTLQKLSSKKTIESNSKYDSNILESIWLNQPRISIKDFLEKGKNLGLWNENFELITQKNSPFSCGKTLLSGMYMHLKGNSIKDNISYIKVGETLCLFFKVEVKTSTKEPYKSFQSSKKSVQKEFSKFFKI